MSRVLPILFNTEMVRAILDGRKTVTRRLVKPQPTERLICGQNWEKLLVAAAAPYQPGDILYVRETWHKYKKRVGNGEGCYIAEFYGYKSSIANSEDANEPWKPSIHMPKEAARIWLKVKDVRVERLRDMSDDDCENEGLENFCKKCSGLFSNCDTCLNDGGIKEDFKELWNSTINKSDLDRYGLDANPWVWVIEFERCEKPENF